MLDWFARDAGARGRQPVLRTQVLQRPHGTSAARQTEAVRSSPRRNDLSHWSLIGGIVARRRTRLSGGRSRWASGFGRWFGLLWTSWSVGDDVGSTGLGWFAGLDGGLGRCRFGRYGRRRGRLWRSRPTFLRSDIGVDDWLGHRSGTRSRCGGRSCRLRYALRLRLGLGGKRWRRRRRGRVRRLHRGQAGAPASA